MAELLNHRLIAYVAVAVDASLFADVGKH